MLREAGLDVTVLEARERVGGRVWSATITNGAVVELGAEWIMDHDAEVLGLAERFGIAAVETGADYGRRDAHGSRRRAVGGPGCASWTEANRLRSAMTPEQAAGVSLGAFLDAVPGDDDARRLVKTRLAGTCAQDLDRVTLLQIADDGRAFTHRADRYFRLGPGNQRLAEALADEVDDVRLGHAVDSIRHDHDGVRVRSGEPRGAGRCRGGGRARADRRAPRFEPALPDDLATALRELPMGVASKLAVATRGTSLGPLAPVDRDLDVVLGGQRMPTVQPRGCVASFAGSPAAQEHLGIPQGRMTPWLEALERMNPDLAFEGEPVMYAWADDPFTLGAYVAWDAPSWARMDVLARPVGRVAFAGEHTAGAAVPRHDERRACRAAGARPSRCSPRSLTWTRLTPPPDALLGSRPRRRRTRKEGYP